MHTDKAQTYGRGCFWCSRYAACRAGLNSLFLPRRFAPARTPSKAVCSTRVIRPWPHTHKADQWLLRQIARQVAMGFESRQMCKDPKPSKRRRTGSRPVWCLEVCLEYKLLEYDAMVIREGQPLPLIWRPSISDPNTSAPKCAAGYSSFSIG